MRRQGSSRPSFCPQQKGEPREGSLSQGSSCCGEALEKGSRLQSATSVRRINQGREGRRNWQQVKTEAPLRDKQLFAFVPPFMSVSITVKQQGQR